MSELDTPMASHGKGMQQASSYRRGEPFPGRHGEKPAAHKEHTDRLALVSLPAPSTRGGLPLWEVMANRRTVRTYTADPLTQEQLSQLLWAGQGITGEAVRFRTVPSAGAIHPFEIYLVVNRVEGLEAGLYHYHVPSAALEFLRPGQLGAALARASLDQDMMERAAVNFALAAVVARATWRYHERAWRYMYLDAGHLVQNLALAATAMGLGLCEIGAFYDGEVDQLFGLDGERETVLYMASVGGSGPVPGKG
ncbi:MAG TPA: SagB/ThcOx family dehydrogenase [Firmicutes bacterium]|nr:SagB/ThcOx family dehydrogenase [Bacillota bacterium]